MVIVGLQQDLQNLKNRIIQLEDIIVKLIENKELLTEKKLTENIEPKITLGKKMVLCDYFGILDKINSISNLNQGDKKAILSLLLGYNEKNIEKFFNHRGNSLTSLLSTDSNYTFLVNLFQERGLKEDEKKAQAMLTKIKNKKQNI